MTPMDSAKIRASIDTVMIQCMGIQMFVWRIIKIGPEDACEEIEIDFFEREKAEAFARNRGWVVED